MVILLLPLESITFLFGESFMAGLLPSVTKVSERRGAERPAFEGERKELI